MSHGPHTDQGPPGRDTAAGVGPPPRTGAAGPGQPSTAGSARDGGAALLLALRFLDRWSASPHHGVLGAQLVDPGIAVLASQVAAVSGGDGRTAGAARVVAARAAAAWARNAGRGPGHRGLYSGGLAGTLVGLRLGAQLHPALHRAADQLRDHLAVGGPPRGWRLSEVAFVDYDLIVGPAGVLLALGVGARPAPDTTAPFLDHLTTLLDSDDLHRLRTGDHPFHPRTSWAYGRVNTGMGHGVAGVVAALAATVRRTGAEPPVATALHRALRWLVGQSFVDARSIRTWAGAELDGAPPPGAHPRQAWCYGTPGVSWAVWDAADALGDQELATWAATVFTSLADHYDERFHLFGDGPEDLLGLCHGAAGVLAVADAFARHAGLASAVELRTRLTRHLTDRLDQLPDDGTHSTGLLNGVPGTLAALLTAGHGAPREWLACLGLR